MSDLPQVTSGVIAMFVLSVSLAFAVGCRMPEPRPTPGQLKLSQLQHGAPSGCSGWTAFLDGPVVGRTRNDGYVKTDQERTDLIPVLDWTVKPDYRQMVEEQTTWEQYQQHTRWHRNLNVFQDTYDVIDYVHKNQLVASEAVADTWRHLSTSNYTNLGVMLAAVDHGSVSVAEARGLLLDWLTLAWRDNPRFNPYLYPGNEQFVSRAVAYGIVSRDEGRWLLAHMLDHARRMNAGLLVDAHANGLLGDEQLDMLVRREAALLAAHPTMQQWLADEPALARRLQQDTSTRPLAMPDWRDVPKPQTLPMDL